MKPIKKERTINKTKIAIIVIFIMILSTWIKMRMVIAQEDSNNKEKEPTITTIEQMNLIDTKSEISFYMDKTELSTLQNNENVQMTATLQSNSNQYDLYKNPSIHILFPKEFEINIKKITLLNFEDIMQIKNATLEKDTEGRKNLKIELEGEQENYSNELNKGIQIAMIGDIQISNTTPSKQTQIEISCSNENAKQQESKTQYPVKINSKYGVLMINKLENYNQEQEIIETIDDKEVKIPLDVNQEERIATR